MIYTFTKKWAYGKLDGKVVCYFKQKGTHKINDGIEVFEVDTKEELPPLDDMRTQEEKDKDEYKIKYREALKELVEERMEKNEKAI